ncbi:uncharacterized protein LOC126272330 [Schistocerca gregaria]|uniref:uncharacterized protein LOC126272330 n=1 Tax=Schistocerca gregaria TaxID=7010 RepID=UPI00211E4DC9|nr:uncharacterized protein LOC126272330 [Schistocerca gregaria]
MKRSSTSASSPAAAGEVRAAARRLARLVRGCEAEAARLPAGRQLLGATAAGAAPGPGQGVAAVAAAAAAFLLFALLLWLLLPHDHHPQEEPLPQSARYGLIETAKPEVASWLAAEQILRDPAPAQARKVANITR